MSTGAIRTPAASLRLVGLVDTRYCYGCPAFVFWQRWDITGPLQPSSVVSPTHIRCAGGRSGCNVTVTVRTLLVLDAHAWLAYFPAEQR